MDEHEISVQSLLSGLKTNSAGLSIEEAELRLNKKGLNEIRYPQTRVVWFHVLHIPVVLAIMMLFFYDMFSAWIALVFFVVLYLIALWAAYESIQLVYDLPESVTVLRGAKRSIETKKVVVGDVIRLEKNDTVPADCRIIDSEDLFLDEHMLGKRLPEFKSAGVVQTDNVLHQTNMLFAGTNIIRGKASCVVVRTSNDTYLGRMYSKLKTSPFKYSKNIFLILYALIFVSAAILLFGGEDLIMRLSALFLSAGAVVYTVLCVIRKKVNVTTGRSRLFYDHNRLLHPPNVSSVFYGGKLIKDLKEPSIRQLLFLGTLSPVYGGYITPTARENGINIGETKKKYVLSGAAPFSQEGFETLMYNVGGKRIIVYLGNPHAVVNLCDLRISKDGVHRLTRDMVRDIKDIDVNGMSLAVAIKKGSNVIFLGVINITHELRLPDSDTKKLVVSSLSVKSAKLLAKKIGFFGVCDYESVKNDPESCVGSVFADLPPLEKSRIMENKDAICIADNELVAPGIPFAEREPAFDSQKGFKCASRLGMIYIISIFTLMTLSVFTPPIFSPLMVMLSFVTLALGMVMVFFTPKKITRTEMMVSVAAIVLGTFGVFTYALKGQPEYAMCVALLTFMFFTAFISTAFSNKNVIAVPLFLSVFLANIFSLIALNDHLFAFLIAGIGFVTLRVLKWRSS